MFRKIFISLILLLALVCAAGGIAWDESSGGNDNGDDGSTDDTSDWGGDHMVAGDEVISKVMAVSNTTADDPTIVLEKSAGPDVDIPDGELANDEFVADNENVFEEKILGDTGLDWLAAQDVRYMLRVDRTDKDSFPVFWQAWCANDFATNVCPLLNDQVEGYPFGVGVQKDIQTSRTDNWLEYKFSVPVDEDYESLVFSYDFRLDNEDVIVQLTVKKGSEETVYRPQIYAAAGS